MSKEGRIIPLTNKADASSERKTTPQDISG